MGSNNELLKAANGFERTSFVDVYDTVKKYVGMLYELPDIRDITISKMNIVVTEIQSLTNWIAENRNENYNYSTNLPLKIAECARNIINSL